MKWLASLLVHEAKRRSQPDVGNLGIGRNPSYGSWFAILGMDAIKGSLLLYSPNMDQGKLMEEDERLRQAVAKGLTDLPKKVPKERMHNTY